MFGFVIANIDALSPEELGRYKGCYCGLCRELGRRQGQLSRLALNYDTTFLVLLLSSLYEPQETQKNARCPIHPLSLHPYWSSKYTEYAADMTVALSHFSCLDDWQDDKDIVRLAEAKVLGRHLSDIEKLWPRQVKAMRESLDKLSALERAGERNADLSAGAFGELMAELMVPDDSDYWADTLRRLGYSLGKFIYMLDAYVDLQKDIKKKRYNPLRFLGADDLEGDMRSVLTMLIADCTAEFEKLPLVQDVAILRNILYSGVWAKFSLGK